MTWLQRLRAALRALLNWLNTHPGYVVPGPSTFNITITRSRSPGMLPFIATPVHPTVFDPSAVTFELTYSIAGGTPVVTDTLAPIPLDVNQVITGSWVTIDSAGLRSLPGPTFTATAPATVPSTPGAGSFVITLAPVPVVPPAPAS